MKYSRSKKFAMIAWAGTFLLTTYFGYLGLEGAASAIFSTGTLASFAVIANKTYQQTQQLKIEKGINNG